MVVIDRLHVCTKSQIFMLQLWTMSLSVLAWCPRVVRHQLPNRRFPILYMNIPNRSLSIYCTYLFQKESCRKLSYERLFWVFLQESGNKRQYYWLWVCVEASGPQYLNYNLSHIKHLFIMATTCLLLYIHASNFGYFTFAVWIRAFMTDLFISSRPANTSVKCPISFMK